MRTKTKKKAFVLDTNVILHDFECIYQFQENDIYLPINVLEELDRFKKGNEQIHFNAREFTRLLDKIAGDEPFITGVSLGKGKGKLFITTGKPFPKAMTDSFFEHSPDHCILAIADWVSKNVVDKEVVFVSKDINLRLKAKSLGIAAEDYRTDKVKDIQNLKREIKIIDNFDTALIARLYNEPNGIDIGEFNFSIEPQNNECMVLRNTGSSVLCRFDPLAKKLIAIKKEKYSGIEPRNAEQTFSFNMLMNPDIKLIALTGRAGTGKTLLALAAALAQAKNYQQIMLARPIVALANRDLGFLPGDANDKILPYMQPLFDNLNVIKHQFSATSKELREIDQLQKDSKLVITPLAYIRGRSLHDTFFIIDEAQNLTPHEIKTIITRAGEDTKMVFTGDIQQIDSPYLDEHSNGLAYLTDRMNGQDIFAHINLLKGERSYLSDLAARIL